MGSGALPFFSKSPEGGRAIKGGQCCLKAEKVGRGASSSPQPKDEKQAEGKSTGVFLLLKRGERRSSAGHRSETSTPRLDWRE